MKDFIVNIYPIRGGEYFTNYEHPLSKKMIREKFNSREEAVKYKNQTEEKFSKRTDRLLNELNIGELMIQFNIEKPDNSFKKYSKRRVTDFVDTFGEYKIEEVTTEALKVWLAQVQRERNIKNVSMRSTRWEVDSFFKYLIEKDVISESPLATIYYQSELKPIKARNLLSPEEIEELLKALKAFSPGYLYPLIRMYAETAAKTAEVYNLLWKDVNLEKGWIHFEKTDSSHERTLKISDELIEILKKKKISKGHVFLTYYGQPFTQNKIRRAILEFRAKGTFEKDWTPMDMRHSFAVNFLKKGGSMRELQYILGHENSFQTKQLYGLIG